jgi:transposase-like protein
LLRTINGTGLESALEEEMTAHLRHEKNRVPVDPDAAGAGNIRNGHRPKTVLTDPAGEVSVQVPRDRAATFEPVIVRKRQRRLSDVDAVGDLVVCQGVDYR